MLYKYNTISGTLYVTAAAYARELWKTYVFFRAATMSDVALCPLKMLDQHPQLHGCPCGTPVRNPPVENQIQNPKQMINIQFNMTPTLAVGVGLVLCVFSV